MSGLASNDLRAYMRRLDLTEARVKGRVTEVYRKLVTVIFRDIVVHTPQYTGNLAYGWEIEMTGHAATQTDRFSAAARGRMHRNVQKGLLDPFKRGDNPAVSAVLQRELVKLDDLRWNSKIKIVNNTSYAEAVDGGRAMGEAPIRPENLYYGAVFMTSRAALKYNQYRNLIKVVAT